MKVPVDYTRNQYYPLLVMQYGEDQAVKILQSGIPINRPGVVPSLQVPAYPGGDCSGLALDGGMPGGFGRLRVQRALGMRGMGSQTQAGAELQYGPDADYAAGQFWSNWVKARVGVESCLDNPETCEQIGHMARNQGWYKYGPYVVGGVGLLLLFNLMSK